MSIPIKTGTVRVYSKSGESFYSTCEMKVGNIASMKLDNGETHNFNLDTCNFIDEGRESDIMVLDLRDASWLEEV